MKTRVRLFAPALLLSLTAFAATPAKKPAPAAGAPKLSIAVGSMVDRRVSADFPPPRLEVSLKLEGEDAASVVSASVKVTKAEDDTGRALAEKGMSGEQWTEARGGEPPAPSLALSSPARKAKALSALEGTVSVYLPARDPGALVTVEKVMAKKDKGAVVSAALAKEKIKLQVLSKAGLEKERAAAKEAEAKKKAAKKKTKDGLEEMGEALGEALGQMFERLFMMAGEHDVILKVEDPGKKLFSFGLIGPDGKPFQTYGTTDVESYRIVRVFEAPPEGTSLQIRLKTPRSFAEIPFKLADLKLP